MTAPDAWDPDRYARFGAERRQPWDDLTRAARARWPGPASSTSAAATGR